LLLVLASAVPLGFESRGTQDYILLSKFLRTPNMEGQVPVFISPKQGGPVIPPGTGFPFVASYDSQGYGGGILTRLHTGTLIIAQFNVLSLIFVTTEAVKQTR
jgi:hypothetical protein